MSATLDSVNHQSNANSRFAKYQQQQAPRHQHGGYQSFTDIGDPSQNPHLFIHVASGNRIARPWQAYIGDLDDFFERIYFYWKNHGFHAIVVQHGLALLKMALAVFLAFFLIHGINYGVTFRWSFPTNATYPNPRDPKGPPLKIAIQDCLNPLSQADVGSIEIILLVFASAFWFMRAVQFVLSVMDNYAIRSFYNEVLQITDPKLYTWQEVQTRLVRNQSQCLIREGHLDELAVHNRLLRRTNYMIALINKGVLPLYYKLPFMGETIFLTNGFEFNLELLLFRGMFSLFEKNWKLRDEVKAPAERLECARRFATRCLVLGIANLLLFPFIFVWQLMFAFFVYIEAIKRDSNIFTVRIWSRYGRWFCRHFNELDHDLSQRLNRAYRPACRYMNSFLSPMLAHFADFFSFSAGAVLSILIVLTLWDEDVITVEHVITIIAALTAVVVTAQAFLPESEPNRWTPCELDAAVIQHIHYRPHGYPAHTPQARTGMSNIFVYRVTDMIEDLLSPIITPYILIRHLRPRSLEIIDFFRVYTLELADIGDVCSFSQFNFQQNGHRIFTEPSSPGKKLDDTTGISATSIGQKAEVLPDERHTTRNGKLELSLINFKLTNPSWQPADNGQAQFIDRFTRQSKDDPTIPTLPLLAHIGAIGEVANSHSTIDFRSPLTSTTAGVINEPAHVLDQLPPQSQSVMKSSHLPLQSQSSSLHQSMQGSMTGTGRDELGYGQKRRRLLQMRLNSMFSEQEERDNEMALSSLYFHQMVSDNVSHGDELGPGGVVVGGTASSFTVPSSTTQSSRRMGARPMSESIPLLHPSSQDPSLNH